MKKYVFSVNSIRELKKDISKFESRLPRLKRKFIKYSLDFLEQRAKYWIRQTTGGSSWYVLTHELENSFKKDATVGKIINDCWWSAYVEFGTGVVGEGTHEDPQNYQYDINNHGEDGWWFKDDKGRLHWTKGMTAHRFMYQAMNEYVNGEYKKIFKKAFDEVIGGIFK